MAQYKAFDDAAQKFGRGSIRLTTRQTIQFHWVAKEDIKGVMKELDSVLLSSQATCGDIVRNVTCALDVVGRPEYHEIQDFAQLLSDHFKSRANAYREIWLDEQPKVWILAKSCGRFGNRSDLRTGQIEAGVAYYSEMV